jgi:hypothetical protein
MTLKGQAWKKTFKVVRSGLPPQNTIDYVKEVEDKCCYLLDALASSADADPLKNDFVSFYFGYSDIVASCELHLFKGDTDLGEVSTLAYGTSYPLGFHEDEVGKKYIGYQLKWRDLLLAEGEGNYYVKAISQTIFSTEYIEESFRYCLREYTANRANGTIRFEFTHSGIIGNRNIDTDIIDFKDLDWSSQIRLKGIVNKEITSTELDAIKYTNGRRVDVSNEQNPTYEIQINPAPYFVHKYMRVDVLQADVILVSDYNALCPLKPFLNQDLKHVGGYEPNWIGKVKNAGVYITMEKRYNNLRKRFC